jgi:hypothetical protein
MGTKAVHIDPSVLPTEARQELADFYQFLVSKYRAKPRKKLLADTVDTFFDKYHLDLSGYQFNRDEIHER